MAYLASFDDIKANDYSLNIPRYIDTSEEEQEVALKQLSGLIRETSRAIKAGNGALLEMLGEFAYNKSTSSDAPWGAGYCGRGGKESWIT